MLRGGDKQVISADVETAEIAAEFKLLHAPIRAPYQVNSVTDPNDDPVGPDKRRAAEVVVPGLVIHVYARERSVAIGHEHVRIRRFQSH